MTGREVKSIIADTVEIYTVQPLMFFTLGNSGKGFNMSQIIHPIEWQEFREDLSRDLGIDIPSFRDMHISRFIDFCIVEVAYRQRISQKQI